MNRVTMRATLNSPDGVEKTSAKGVGVLALIEQEDGSCEVRMLGKVNPMLAMSVALQNTGRLFDSITDDHTRDQIMTALERVQDSTGKMLEVMRNKRSLREQHLRAGADLGLHRALKVG